ncbi:glycosyltransferase family 4 protein [Candidatus Peregrinibacteria bacterium]|nr:glycosyltransferase family 4 protein [Candidatus Peregrinibacteria bacterium]
MTLSPSQILWLDPADFLGGAELFSLDLFPELSRKFAITVLTGSTSSDFAVKIPSNIRVQKFLFPRLKPPSPKTFAAFFRTAHELKKFLEKNTYDILHTNSIRTHILASYVLKKIPRNRAPKLTFFVHDFTFPSWAVWAFAGRADKIFCCSHAVESDLQAKGISPEKIRVIPNGIRSEKFTSNPHKKTPHEFPTIAILGRIDEWKGQHIFLEAVKILQKSLPNLRWKIIGKSSSYDVSTEKYEKTLREFVQKNSLEMSGEFCGFLPSEKALSGIDLLIHASTQKEPFGRVLLEAMAAGVPVIASNLGGPQEILRNDLPEFLISPRDPKLLAEKILTILNSPELLQKFREKSEKIIREKYELSLISEKIGKEWDLLLSEEHF